MRFHPHLKHLVGDEYDKDQQNDGFGLHWRKFERKYNRNGLIQQFHAGLNRDFKRFMDDEEDCERVYNTSPLKKQVPKPPWTEISVN